MRVQFDAWTAEQATRALVNLIVRDHKTITPEAEAALGSYFQTYADLPNWTSARDVKEILLKQMEGFRAERSFELSKQHSLMRSQRYIQQIRCHQIWQTMIGARQLLSGRHAKGRYGFRSRRPQVHRGPNERQWNRLPCRPQRNCATAPAKMLDGEARIYICNFASSQHFLKPSRPSRGHLHHVPSVPNHRRAPSLIPGTNADVATTHRCDSVPKTG
jgi:hypothetical protein